jgi:hypothetical protein
MISKNFAWTIFVVFTIAIAFFLYVNISQTNDIASPTAKTPSSVPQEKNLPAPTGSVEDLTKDLQNSAESEQALTAQEDGDKTLIDTDMKIFDEFGQSYNENEL